MITNKKGIDMNDSKITVLYNRPNGLAVDKHLYSGTRLDEKTLYKLKLLQLSPAFLKEGALEVFTQTVDSIIDSNISELLSLSIALMGGAFREQLNYLGLFPIKETIGETSVCRCYINNINKRTFNIGTDIIKTKQSFTSDSNLKQLFYYLSDAAKDLTTDKLTLMGSHLGRNSFILQDILSTHDTNLEHAAGVLDLYSYILGNTYYSCQFDFKYEHFCNINDCEYFIADGLVSTMYKNKRADVFVTNDYIEVDTGSQGSEVIKEKIINYTKFFTNQKCVPALNNIIFINHPNGMCSNLPGKKNTAVSKKPTFLEKCSIPLSWCSF